MVSVSFPLGAGLSAARGTFVQDFPAACLVSGENPLVWMGFRRSCPLSAACLRVLRLLDPGDLPQQLWPPSQTQAGDTQQSPHAGTCPRVNPEAGERHRAIFADSHLSELCIPFCHLRSWHSPVLFRSLEFSFSSIAGAPGRSLMASVS